MNVQELREKLKSGERIVLLDVRERDELKESPKIESAVNIPMGGVSLEEEKGTFAKDIKIVTICRSGARSGMIARTLKQKGYDVENLEGGMLEWERTQ
ncbi:hypothetical protein A2524_00160 [Candidatus Wolfebacteria bacterium RIFOXYD12_FULL_48_21]|uniref:Rhodanese domain-containing protein n=1 Tax=Candidatus Wolfebacteria bacterium RIFOXYD1_FULL_48_65 TaxID=1802561 RepID=A0A1F8E415_9BACT|nr:MAG: hypothetical protein A2524_00160 [Candidatus Wolfebacteria bacterium RIFOXYD12_FULL_48_21]OGM95460.1 MAG: hypothetical protein A2610_01045 [Candidatus Wolfebacteria bacterium RIFOXYD1_FULL_48_65]OGM97123.1 MAG: hypothetical protein A2532_03045 [Candidatus Wolfebacteria bacterium RIFOXYD2_FULL_48_11]